MLKERVGSKLGLACLYLEDSASTKSLLSLTMTPISTEAESSPSSSSSSASASKSEEKDARAATTCWGHASGWLPAADGDSATHNDDFSWRASSEACVLLNQVLGVAGGCTR
jgi:hypothetical protein